MKKKLFMCLALCGTLIMLCGCNIGLIPSAENVADDPAPVNLESAEPVQLTFVSITDLHGDIEQDRQGFGGLSNTEYMIDTLSQFSGDDDPDTSEKDDIVLVANGDMLEGTGMSNAMHGLPVIEAMNEMQFDAMNVGNHEFNWGLGTVLYYFDGKSSDDSEGAADNGDNIDGDIKANFPLLTANIIDDTNTLIADADENDNVVSSIIVDKMGVKVGIIGAIGPLESHISPGKLAEYAFLDVVKSVREEAVALRSQGAEIVSVNVHYSNWADPASGKMCTEIGAMKDKSGRYLVDMVFIGHSHELYSGEVVRDDAVNMPVVQGGDHNKGIAYVTVDYDPAGRKIISCKQGYKMTADVAGNYDQAVEDVVDKYVDMVKNDEPLAISGVTYPDKDSVLVFDAQAVIKKTGADIAVLNYGSVGMLNDIMSKEALSVLDVTSLYMFDDTIYLVQLKGDDIANLYDDMMLGGIIADVDGIIDASALKGSRDVYTVAVSDYVYYKNYFKKTKENAIKIEQLRTTVQDAIIAELRALNEQGLVWNPVVDP